MKFSSSSRASLSLIRSRKNDKKNTGADISLFCLLKLIDKIDLDDDTVSECYKQYIKRFQGDRDKYVNVYSIPQYNYDKLSGCNEMAKQVKEKNLRKKHFTYESVANAFGTDTADKVFPQVKGKRVRDIDEYLLYAIEILLEKYGYYVMQTVECDNYNHKRYWISEFSKKLIPIPPQKEQVHIIEKIDTLYECIGRGLN